MLTKKRRSSRQIRINNLVLQHTDAFKFLGLHFVTWRNHIFALKQTRRPLLNITKMSTSTHPDI